MVNEKRTNWDEHLSTILFSYKIAYKVATSYTPYQLVYDLHPLMPIKYVLLVISGDHRDAKPTRVLIARITKLKKLKEIDWNSKQCGSQPVELIFVELTENY